MTQFEIVGIRTEIMRRGFRVEWLIHREGYKPALAASMGMGIDTNMDLQLLALRRVERAGLTTYLFLWYAQICHMINNLLYLLIIFGNLIVGDSHRSTMCNSISKTDNAINRIFPLIA